MNRKSGSDLFSDTWYKTRLLFFSPFLTLSRSAGQEPNCSCVMLPTNTTVLSLIFYLIYKYLLFIRNNLQFSLHLLQSIYVKKSFSFYLRHLCLVITQAQPYKHILFKSSTSFVILFIVTNSDVFLYTET